MLRSGARWCWLTPSNSDETRNLQREKGEKSKQGETTAGGEYQECRRAAGIARRERSSGKLKQGFIYSRWEMGIERCSWPLRGRWEDEGETDVMKIGGGERMGLDQIGWECIGCRLVLYSVTCSVRIGFLGHSFPCLVYPSFVHSLSLQGYFTLWPGVDQRRMVGLIQYTLIPLEGWFILVAAVTCTEFSVMIRAVIEQQDNLTRWSAYYYI